MAKTKKPEQEILDRINEGNPVNLLGEGVFMSLYKSEDGAYIATSKQKRVPDHYETEETFLRYIFTLLERGYVEPTALVS